MDYIPETEVTKMVKRILNKAFPKIKFSVRCKKYSGGSSIDVNWIDGPTYDMVNSLVAKYHGTNFDGMIDLASPNGQPYANDYIFCNRYYTKSKASNILTYFDLTDGYPKNTKLLTEAGVNSMRGFYNTVKSWTYNDKSGSITFEGSDLYNLNRLYDAYEILGLNPIIDPNTKTVAFTV